MLLSQFFIIITEVKNVRIKFTGMTEREQFIQYLRYEKRYSPHTVLAYEQDLAQLSEYLSTEFLLTSLREVTASMIRSWMVDQADKHQSNRTINRKLSAFKAFFRFLKREGILEESPMLKIQSPKTPKRLPSFVETEKMDRLFDPEMFPDDFEGKRDAMILTLLYASGMRLSELIGLRERDLDYDRMTIKVLGKRNKERYIPMGPNLKKELQVYLDFKHKSFPLVDTNNDFLIVTNTGTRSYSRMIYRITHHYLSKVTTQEKRSPHVLRHTFATHMLNEGADLNAIKEILGHANLSATQVYTHNTIEKLKKIYKQAHPKA